MWSENDAYFDYVEIRRRIERRLSSGTALVLHLGVYLAVMVGLIGVFGRVYGSATVTWVNLFMAGWSGVLLLHGLWTARQSALSNSQRHSAVHAEITERLDASDTELLADVRGVFRVQSLIEEDVRMRAGWNVSLLGYILVMNAAWGVNMLTRQIADATIWHILILMSFFALPVIYSFNKGRRYLRNRKLERVFATHPRQHQAVAKEKRSFEADLNAYARLSDDGELVDAPPDWAAYQRNRNA
jgi:hypothetical protein